MTRTRGGRNWSSSGLLALLLTQAWVLTAAVARLGVSTPERVVFRTLHALPAALAAPLVVVMPLGTLVGGLVVAALAWFVTRATGQRLTLAVPLAWVAATATKSAIDRGRPVDVLQHVVTTTSASGPGYPSGHTAVAVALAVALWPDLGRAGRVVVATLAGMVALARVTTGVHLPLDLLGGAAIGALAGLAARRVVRTVRARG